MGAVSVLFDAAEAAFVPALVERGRLGPANSQLQVAEQAAGIGGPGLGGLLAAVFGPPLVLVVDAVSYLASGLLIGGIDPRREEPARPAPKQPLRIAIREGLRCLLGDPRLRAPALTAEWLNLFGRMISAVLVLYLVRAGGLNPSWIGLVLSAESCGFVVGAQVSSRLGRVSATGRVISWGTIPLAGTMAGAGAQLVGLRQMLLVAAFGALFASVPLFAAKLPARYSVLEVTSGS